jgi:hypothetical protein
LHWAGRTPRHSAASLVQAPTGSALPGCAPAAPVGVRVHRAIPDRRRGSETYRKGTWALTTGADSGVRLSRRAFDIETAETTDTDRVLPRFSFPDFLPREAHRVAPSIAKRTHQTPPRPDIARHDPAATWLCAASGRQPSRWSASASRLGGFRVSRAIRRSAGAH